MKVELGCMLALTIDALPVPANTLGYVVTDEPAAHREVKPGPMCGGPSRQPGGGAVMIASLLGLTLGILFRVDYRRLDLPRPAPPRIFGALLIVFITLGVLSTGLTLAHIGRDV